MKNLVMFMALTLFTCTPAFAQSAASSAQLSPAQVRELSGLKFKDILIPGSVPPGLKLKEVTVHTDGRFGGASYQLHYAGPQGQVFNVFGQKVDRPPIADQGKPPDRKLPFRSPLLGNGVLNWHEPSSGGAGPFTRGNLVFRFSSMQLEQAQALRTLEGLRLLR